MSNYKTIKLLASTSNYKKEITTIRVLHISMFKSVHYSQQHVLQPNDLAFINIQ